MFTYPLVNAPRLGQAPAPAAAPAAAPPMAPPTRTVPATAVNAAIISLGLGMSVAGYYARKTDLGMIGMGAGSSIVGAGIVLLILDWTGIPSGGQV